MAKIFYASDCNLGLLDGKTVAVIGYGSQGHAHALNLHESGVDVIVGLYEGSKSWPKAESAGLKVATVSEAAKAAEENAEEKKAAVGKCSSCGAVIEEEDQKFCEKCGNLLSKESVEEVKGEVITESDNSAE